MDSIESLNLDNNQKLSPTEVDVMTKYFHDKASKVVSASSDNNIQQAIFLSILFILINNPLADKLVEMLPISNMWYMRYGIKLAIFFVLAYVILIT